jgi:hypothetical protein
MPLFYPSRQGRSKNSPVRRNSGGLPQEFPVPDKVERYDKSRQGRLIP